MGMDSEPTSGVARRSGAWAPVAAIGACLLVGAGLAWAGSDGGARVGAVPAFALCAIAALAVNWAAFVPAALLRTERFYDLTGTISYLLVVAIALLAGSGSATAALLAVLVAVWALRLGTFLVRRIARDGTDDRFDELKARPLRFLVTWTVQALWVLVTAGAALAAMTSGEDAGIGVLAVVGAVVWVVGFAVEAVADAQKRAFRADAANRDRFITTGLWAWSRHPNYFGEITLWVGIALIALPALSGWQHLTLVSPVFVALLLTRVSGIPLLEAKGRRRWGDDPAYRDYVARTPALVPRPPAARRSAA
jgi:steroid 5-alpha reductase family enzyme